MFAAMACFDALRKTYTYLTPDLWPVKELGKQPYTVCIRISACAHHTLSTCLPCLLIRSTATSSTRPASAVKSAFRLFCDNHMLAPSNHTYGPSIDPQSPPVHLGQVTHTALDHYGR